MSSLWTPGGERPIRRDPPTGEPEHPGGPPDSGSSGGWSGGGGGSRGGGSAGGTGAGAGAGEPSPEEMQARMAELQEQLARTPAYLVVANHAFGLFELAALHLSLQPPQLDQASLAIDAMAALVEGLGDRLGEHAAELSDGLAQLRMAYVEIHGAQGAGAGGGVAGGGGARGDGNGGGAASGAGESEDPAGSG